MAILRAGMAGVVCLALVCGCGGGDARPVERTPEARGTSPVPSPVPPTTPEPSPPVVRVPDGVRASYVVFDRATGRVVAERGARRVFRSASVVKILVALDYLERNKASAADRKLLGLMLRSSDDKAATEFWTRGGRKQIIARMVARLGLEETAPPPDDKPGYWGYTALSARDLVKTYRYLLDRAPKTQREFVLEQLRGSTPCGTDGFDQTFGIPRAAKRPWAVKQGWSGFGDVPAEPCHGRRPQQVRPRRIPWRPDLGIGRPVLHTTGVVGDKIVVVLTLQPAGTSFRAASRRVTELTRQLV